MVITDFGEFLSLRMQAEHRTLAQRWFERLVDILPVNAREVFPTESLLDHVPSLILEISDYLRRPAGEAIASNTLIIEKAGELGTLRHEQRASLHQVLREYQILGGVLVSFVLEELERPALSPPPREAVQLVSRIHQAVAVLSQATVEVFVGLYTQTITEQAERLDQFTRMVTHEWRQPLGALQFGIRVLRFARADDARDERTLAALDRSVKALVELTQKLESMARVRGTSDNPVLQAVPVASVAHEAARQLREMAEARRVEILVSDSQPTAVLDVGRLELALVNLISNAIKYSDPEKRERHVEIRSEVGDDRWLYVSVRDNGVGIPSSALSTIFERFTRAHTNDAQMAYVSGIGLGLSIVEDCVRTMGGSIGVESVEGQGTTFTMRLPAQPAS